MYLSYYKICHKFFVVDIKTIIILLQEMGNYLPGRQPLDLVVHLSPFYRCAKITVGLTAFLLLILLRQLRLSL